ncbi:MAG: hypothetical protein AVDCRST_MAG03-417, partial [uncultured Rubrobacteraceae bacterium]
AERRSEEPGRAGDRGAGRLGDGGSPRRRRARHARQPRQRRRLRGGSPGPGTQDARALRRRLRRARPGGTHAGRADRRRTHRRCRGGAAPRRMPAKRGAAASPVAPPALDRPPGRRAGGGLDGRLGEARPGRAPLAPRPRRRRRAPARHGHRHKTDAGLLGTHGRRWRGRLPGDRQAGERPLLRAVRLRDSGRAGSARRAQLVHDPAGEV